MLLGAVAANLREWSALGSAVSHRTVAGNDMRRVVLSSDDQIRAKKSRAVGCGTNRKRSTNWRVHAQT